MQLSTVPPISMANYGVQNHSDAINSAESRGFVVNHGSATKLLLDYDDDVRGRVAFADGFDLVNQNFGISSQEWYQSKTLGHSHCVVMLKTPVTPVEALLLQACLGSDPRRELLGLVRIRQGVPNPSVLFRPFAQKAVKSDAPSREVQL